MCHCLGPDLHVCVCVCVIPEGRLYVYIDSCTHMYICTSVSLHMYTLQGPDIYVLLYVYIDSCTHMYICTSVSLHMYTLQGPDIYVYVCICVCGYTCTHT